MDLSELLFVVEGRPPRPWKELSMWEQDLVWARSQTPDPNEKEPPGLVSIDPLAEAAIERARLASLESQAQ